MNLLMYGRGKMVFLLTHTWLTRHGIIKIEGVGYGITRIQAKNGPILVIELELDVKNEKRVKLGFTLFAITQVIEL